MKKHLFYDRRRKIKVKRKKSIKKSQITIFVILFFVLVILYVYIIHQANVHKLDVAKESTQKTSSTQSNFNIFSLKSYVGTCLERSLDRALVLAGLQGGYVDFTKLNPTKFYEIKNGVDLSLFPKSLGMDLSLSQANLGVFVYSPFYNKSINYPVFSNLSSNFSVEKNFREFLLNDTFRCLNLSHLRDLGYKIKTEEKPNITVNFYPERVKVSLFYPIKLFKNGQESDFYKTTLVKYNSLEKLTYIATYFINSMYENTSANYSKVMNESISFYGLNPKNFVFKRVVKLNLPYKKVYTYVLKDSNSRIKNYPYVFEFGYIDNAPFLDLSPKAGAPFMVSPFFNDTYYTYLSVGTVFKIDLHKYLHDNNYYDDVFNKHFFSVDQDTSEYEFKLEQNGSLIFIPKTNNFYSFKITATDGVCTRDYILQFITPVFKNKNNEKTGNYVYATALERKGFPIDDKYLHILKYYKDSKGYYHYYTFGLKKGQVKLSFLFIPNGELSVSTVGCDDFSNNICTLNLGSSKKTVTFEIKNGNNVLSTYVVDVYPVACMGPGPVSKSVQEVVGGDFTCCNLQSLDDAIKNNNPSVIKNIYGFSHIAADFNAYVHLDVDVTNKLDLFDFVHKSIWDTFNNKYIMSLYSSHIKMICNGQSPLPWNGNVQSIGDITKIFNGTVVDNTIYKLDHSITLHMNLVRRIKQCNFVNSFNCTLSKLVSKNNLVYDLAEETKIVSTDFGSGLYTYIGPLSQGNSILYSSKKYGSTDGSTTWTTSRVGKGGKPGTVYLGKKFCVSKNSNPVYQVVDSKTDNPTGCKDYYFNGNEIVSAPAPSSWICGTGTQTCKCGSCTYNNMCSGSSYQCSNVGSCTCPACPKKDKKKS